MLSVKTRLLSEIDLDRRLITNPYWQDFIDCPPLMLTGSSGFGLRFPQFHSENQFPPTPNLCASIGMKRAIHFPSRNPFACEKRLRAKHSEDSPVQTGKEPFWGSRLVIYRKGYGMLRH